MYCAANFFPDMKPTNFIYEEILIYETWDIFRATSEKTSVPECSLPSFSGQVVVIGIVRLTASVV
jgi:hypothetical protein